MKEAAGAFGNPCIPACVYHAGAVPGADERATRVSAVCVPGADERATRVRMCVFVVVVVGGWRKGYGPAVSVG